MKIAIIGAGAVGCVLAARLGKAGEDVTLIGREDQVRALNERGLTLRGAAGAERVNVRAEARLGAAHDLVVFATKTQDLGEAVRSNGGHLDGCSILTTQNGVRADEALAEHFERERILSCIVMFGATYTALGEVTLNFDGRLIIGCPFPSPRDAGLHAVAEAIGRAFDVVETHEIMAMKHLKLFVNFNNCIPALIGQSMQATFSDLDLCRLSVMLLEEGVEIVRSAGIGMASLPGFPEERISGLVSAPIDQAAGIIKRTLTGLSQEPLYGSILQSILRGKRSEIDFINGEVVRIAAGRHARAPLNEKVVDMVHQVERTGRFFGADEVKRAFDLRSNNRRSS
jgi:2-dehydropantoate 2-reductase